MPLLESRISAVPPVCNPIAEFSRLAALDVVLVFTADVLDVAELDDEPVVPLPPDVLVEDEEDAPDEVLEPPPEAEVGVVGWKKLLPAPNPTLPA
jgi:hypothetical protein